MTLEKRSQESCRHCRPAGKGDDRHWSCMLGGLCSSSPAAPTSGASTFNLLTLTSSRGTSTTSAHSLLPCTPAQSCGHFFFKAFSAESNQQRTRWTGTVFLEWERSTLHFLLWSLCYIMCLRWGKFNVWEDSCSIQSTPFHSNDA